MNIFLGERKLKLYVFYGYVERVVKHVHFFINNWILLIYNYKFTCSGRVANM